MIEILKSIALALLVAIVIFGMQYLDSISN